MNNCNYNSIFPFMKYILDKSYNLDINICNIEPNKCSIYEDEEEDSSDKYREIIFCDNFTINIPGEQTYQVPITFKVFPMMETTTSKGFLYEMEMYKYINTLLRYTPNFLPCITSGTCPNINNIIKKKSNSDIFPILKKKPDINLAIIGTLNLKQYRSFSLHEYMKVLNNNLKQSKVGTPNYVKAHKTLSAKMYPIFLQILYTLEVLRQKHISHYDLHFTNIIIVQFSSNFKIKFNTGTNESYVIETDMIPFIYDWDMSYSEKLGDNLQLDVYKGSWFRTNKFKVDYDLYSFLCFLDSDYPNVRSHIDFLEVISKHPDFNTLEQKNKGICRVEGIDNLMSPLNILKKYFYVYSSKMTAVIPTLEYSLPSLCGV